MRISFFVLLVASTAVAADPPKFDRTIGQEPKYAGKPVYCLLAFDADAKHRVWLVHDGDTLYVDRNGNGDLTDDGEKFTADKPKVAPADGTKSYTFDVPDMTVGGKTHKGLQISAVSLKEYADGSLGNSLLVKAVLSKLPDTMCYRLSVEAERPGLPGGGSGGRVSFSAGPFDRRGPLLFTAKPADAPVVHIGGRLELTFYSSLPQMRPGRSSEFMMVVGAPGQEAGTFAMLLYDGTVPKDAHPVAEVTFPAAKPDDPPVTEKFELKERC
jgi:hypothetical protein